VLLKSGRGPGLLAIVCELFQPLRNDIIAGLKTLYELDSLFKPLEEHKGNSMDHSLSQFSKQMCGRSVAITKSDLKHYFRGRPVDVISCI